MKYYRFRPTLGWAAHLLKSTTRQDHKFLKPIFSKYLPDDGVAFDIGAHGGQISRLLSTSVPYGSVYAVEPSSYTRSILRISLAIRRVKNVVVLPFALGASASQALIQTPLKRRRDMGYGLANITANPDQDSVVELVSVTRLDDLSDILSIKRIDFIKIDIEGYEYEAILGAECSIRKFKPAILMEMDDELLRRAGSSLDMLWHFMLDLGYVPLRLDESPLPLIVPSALCGDVLWVIQTSI